MQLGSPNLQQRPKVSCIQRRQRKAACKPDQALTHVLRAVITKGRRDGCGADGHDGRAICVCLLQRRHLVRGQPRVAFAPEIVWPEDRRAETPVRRRPAGNAPWLGYWIGCAVPRLIRSTLMRQIASTRIGAFLRARRGLRVELGVWKVDGSVFRFPLEK